MVPLHLMHKSLKTKNGCPQYQDPYSVTLRLSKNSLCEQWFAATWVTPSPRRVHAHYDDATQMSLLRKPNPSFTTKRSGARCFGVIRRCRVPCAWARSAFGTRSFANLLYVPLVCDQGEPMRQLVSVVPLILITLANRPNEAPPLNWILRKPNCYKIRPPITIVVIWRWNFSPFLSCHD